MKDQFNYSRIQQFDLQGSYYLNNHPKRTKFRYALERVSTQLLEIARKAQARLMDIDINNCLTSGPDGTGEILHEPDIQLPNGDTTPGRVKMSKEGKLAASKERRAFFAGDNPEDLFEIETHFVKEVPKDLTLIELDAFRGFILSDAQYEAEMTRIEEEYGEPEEPAQTSSEATN